VPRVVAVTGASSGVGRACARLFGSRGDAVALIARNAEALKVAAREVEEAGGRALMFPVDVSDAAAVEQAATGTEEELGSIDLWVNDAMVSVYSPVWDLTSSEAARVMDVNYLGTVNGTLSALRRMRARDSGTIVQVGSGLAYRAIPLQAAYCASKHAIRAFTEAVRTELLHDGSKVRITIVQLPGLNTPHFTLVRSRMKRGVRPVSPIYTPELAARVVGYAADHPMRREYVVGALTAMMILGQKLAPGLLDRYLAATGISSQLTTEPTEPRAGNLFATSQGDLAASGPFVDEARDRSIQWFLSRHRRPLVLAGVAAAIGSLRRRG
jgi:NADP-dependent 3-hydroxy acid dehydrogenase YdfG